MKSYKLIIATLLFILWGNYLNAQQANFEWGMSVGGSSFDSGVAAVTDKSSNVFTIGSFSGTVDFDPGVAVANLLGSGSFIQKKDNNGNFLWVKGINGSINFWSMNIDTIGNLYITGAFAGTVNFNPGLGTSNLTSNGSYDIFILKLNNDGDLLWAKSIGGPDIDYGQGVNIDLLGNVYVTGFFGGIVDFDPGNGTSNLTSNGNEDIFILKLNNNGSLSWAKSMGGISQDKGFSIILDTFNNIYTTGAFEGTVDFDPGNGVSNLTAIGSSRDIFIQKLDNNGDLIWVKSIGGASSSSGHSIGIDVFGDVYVAGHFDGTVDFDSGSGVTNQTAIGPNNIFLLKLNDSGTFSWVRTIIGAGGFNAPKLALDNIANVYLTCHYWGSADFDPGSGVANLTAVGDADIFIQKLDLNGDFVWAQSIGGPFIENSSGISLDKLNNIYLTGSFADTADLNPGLGIDNFISNGASDVFTIKLSQNIFSSLKDKDYKFPSVTVYPNPTTDILYIEGNNNQGKEISIKIFDSWGQLLISKQSKNSIEQLRMSSLPSGAYYVCFENGFYSKTQKIIKN